MLFAVISMLMLGLGSEEGKSEGQGEGHMGKELLNILVNRFSLFSLSIGTLFVMHASRRKQCTKRQGIIQSPKFKLFVI